MIFVKLLSIALVQDLQSIAKLGKDHWTAHVTLATIMTRGRRSRRSKTQLKILNEILKDLSDQEEATIICESSLTASGIAMGGPTPEQVALDWNFRFHPPLST